MNLAPTHKQGLTLAHPLILGAGTVSYGETMPPGVDPARLGGVVVGPVMAQSRSGQHGPRLAHQAGGLVLDHGGQNRGSAATVRRFARVWASLPCAVIVQLADTDPQALVETLNTLHAASGFDAVELLIPDSISAKRATALMETAQANSDVPLLVKLPILRAARLAEIALNAGAACLVLGESSLATLPRHAPVHRGVHYQPDRPDVPPPAPQLVSGRFYGPANFAPMLHALVTVRAAYPHAAIIASGGIHTPLMAQQALALGANAIALDSVVWIDPASVHAIAAALDIT